MNEATVSSVDVLNESRSGLITTLILPASTLFLIGRPQDMIPFIGLLRPAYVFFFILICSLVWGTKENEIPTYRDYSEVKYTVVFFILIYVSFLWAEMQGVSYAFLLQFLVVPAYFLCLCKYTSTFNELRRQMWILSISVFWYAVMSYMKSGTMERVLVGDMYDPNDLALILVCNLPFAYLLYATDKGFLRKLFLLATIILSIISVILTKSRGGFLGILMMIVLFAFMRTNLHKTRFSIGKIVAICIIPLIFNVFGSGSYWDRINTIFGPDKGSGRTGVWLRAIEMIEERPITGVGVDNFTSSYGFRIKAGKFEHKPKAGEWAPGAWVTAHNSFLLVAAELGFPGLLLYITILGSCIASFRRIRLYAWRKGDEILFLATGMLSLSFLSFIICAFFLSFTYQVYFFYLVSMAVILRSIAERRIAVTNGSATDEVL